MTAALDDARDELRRRQGGGARYDADTAPHRELEWARLGTAYAARCVNDLPDDAFAAPSLLSGWSRAALVAHLGYNARALSRLAEWARTGVETPMYASPGVRDAEIRLGATLPVRALRNLFDHAAVHLNVEWRDLSSEQWDSPVRTAQGRTVPARETAWMRAREVWVHAIDLGSGASFADLPPELLDALVADVIRVWDRRGETPHLVLEPSDRESVIAMGTSADSDETVTVRGAQADMVRWLTGRGARRLEASTGGVPMIPRWF